MSALKNELIGSWRLLSYIEIPLRGGDSYFPLGKSPKGLLLYGQDGFMSLQLSASEEISRVEDKNNVRSLHGYMAFSGKYTVDHNYAHVTCFIDTSSFPLWEGTKQVRKVDFEGDVLFQKTVEPIMSDGQLVHGYMTWKRMDKETEEDLLLTEQVVHFEV